ncbi:hypothetical protein EVAR_88371_1 [Eumeta japonica]|uniref:Uncharacterized protein n=1 Tax=Eumeta variegata TaxID=151549 RepID=A0A4C1XDZ4_EUMVA|nr:hypothetical protein EVAR_88371_1 [Eumeta japonica]
MAKISFYDYIAVLPVHRAVSRSRRGRGPPGASRRRHSAIYHRQLPTVAKKRTAESGTLRLGTGAEARAPTAIREPDADGRGRRPARYAGGENAGRRGRGDRYRDVGITNFVRCFKSDKRRGGHR